MRVIHARNVNHAFTQAVRAFVAVGVEQPSRAGDTLEIATPVSTVYERPCERVLFNEVRDANPFFFLHEALWMLGGRDDVESLTQFVKTMRNYSDDGKTFHAAYGHRWRSHFGRDQLVEIVTLLQRDPDSRRAVLQIWDTNSDLGTDSKDIPCNDLVFFKIRNNQLNMLVSNRSNDMIWGAYGANAVHFSFLQEYMAGMIGCEVGTYTQVSDSFHVYKDVFQKIIGQTQPTQDPYERGEVASMPLVDNAPEFDVDLYNYLSDDRPLFYANTFFESVAEPMRKAYFAHKEKNDLKADYWLSRITASDWKRAAVEWISRRRKARDSKQEKQHAE
jgi:thymidylate synthase